ncbi:stage III sporulation protein AG [Caproiciproducens faecalis]|uniref:Stage III sporulation protein AG n=1 Tax=Caproiciproducens faecalis TaxID=2820301 RepID=A0ABS7DR12_9FIRM|nr:stage III sporulation protein AG [Caproiciproducens faecalis]MBW7573467.1 stage III sporulation protein AG [Caproiciproducens faecalis]
MKANDSGLKEEKETILSKLAGNDFYRKIIIVAGLVGIAFIFLSSYLNNYHTDNTKTVSSQPTVTAEQYAEELETSLTDLVTRIQGAGAAKVLVTLERSTQYVYATEEKKSNQTTEDKSDGSTTKNEANDNTETTYILVKDADGAQKALAVTEVQPIIKGVVVVCDGGDNPVVQQDIISAVTTALDITSVRVCVIKAK